MANMGTLSSYVFNNSQEWCEIYSCFITHGADIGVVIDGWLYVFHLCASMPFKCICPLFRTTDVLVIV